MANKVSAKDRLSNIIKKTSASKPFNENLDDKMQIGNGSENLPDFSADSQFKPGFGQNDKMNDFKPFTQEEEDENSFDGFSEYSSPILSDDDEVPMKRMIEGEKEDKGDSFDELESSFNHVIKEKKEPEKPIIKRRGRKSQEELNRQKEMEKEESKINLGKIDDSTPLNIPDYEGLEKKENNMNDLASAPMQTNDNNFSNKMFESIVKKLALNLINQAKNNGIVVDGFNNEDMIPVWEYITNKINN